VERDHERGPDHGRARAVQAQAGDAAHGHDDVGRDEDDGGYTQVGSQAQGRMFQGSLRKKAEVGTGSPVRMGTKKRKRATTTTR
jgi:hypothetical protein